MVRTTYLQLSHRGEGLAILAMQISFTYKSNNKSLRAVTGLTSEFIRMWLKMGMRGHQVKYTLVCGAGVHASEFYKANLRRTLLI